MSLPETRDNIVLFSAHPWEGTPYGLHHMARALADGGNSVLFVEPAFSPMHIAGQRRRGRRASLSLRESGVHGIWLFSPFTMLPHQNAPLLKSKWMLSNWESFSFNSLRRAVRSTRFEKPDISISGTTAFLKLQRALGAGLIAFRLADDERLFPSVTAAMHEQSKVSIRTVDVVFATTENLCARAEQAGAKCVVLMPNGYSTDILTLSGPEPAALHEIPRPRIIYVGAMDRWFDWSMIAHASAAMPAVQFLLVGTPPRKVPDLPKNVHLFGWMEHGAAMQMVSHSDVGLIPFALPTAEAEPLGYIDPIKLWEYAAARLPVVASNHLILPDMPDIIHRYSSSQDFSAAISSALGLTRPLTVSASVRERSWQSIVSNALAIARRRVCQAA